ncbi:L-histidine N(alpha)-methyltransferase [Noviherbaspirillum galbum]|uniref:L-histidine N(alpha)-methyltransferase n=1 Tax=Noviherbaspirillum galbum TaxID=2709383 RepID=UPI001F282EAD|nr:L-histidine N(alpha)-methyltransferase [Noviherbaspirillum galbum]
MSYGFIQLYQQNDDAVRAELREGLLDEHPWISPKYLYDALGSKLFAAICALPEYYPTRTEQGILQENMRAIGKSVGRGVTLIDLGAGDCAKAAKLFPALQPAQYVPVDISVEYLREAVSALQCLHPQIQMNGIGMDFSGSLDLPDEVRREKRLFFYPGSSIGNFTPEQAAAFLGNVRDACGRDGGLLIGVDLIKDPGILEPAYDDAIGLTAAFNLNMLQHLNVLLGADFRPNDWRHRARFHSGHGRIEMHLEARSEVQVRWNGGGRLFHEGQWIHTESSYKYTREAFLAMLERAGFGEVRCWTDPNNWFLVCHARA